ncbi:MAG TPA: NnrU family protein [Allosphingosinicella sp.]|nr:NnrU family protein [Allosphingosinicella sp.]
MIATASLALAMLAFVGTHLLMSHTFRTRIVGTIGDELFLALYSAVAAVTLLWVIASFNLADEGELLWIAPEWAWPVAGTVMLVACVLLVGSFVRNPAFPHPGAKPKAVPAAVGVFAITRHPMNWAFMLWAGVHIALWGSIPNLIVAGGVLILAAAGSVGQDHKKLNVIGRPWRQWMDRTSFVPFAALLAGRVKWNALKSAWPALAGGLVLWLAVTWFHAPRASPLRLLLG